MAEKDILEKILLAHADVFADCVNALAHGGERRLREESMHPAPTESFYHGRRKKRAQFCDRSFFLMEEGRIRAQYFIENETRMGRRQVLRKASYQGGAYREQLESRQPVYPVVGIGLDWTSKKSRIPLSLRRLLAADGAEEAELRLIDDIGLRLYHMKNLPDSVRVKFTSDMGFVVDYLNEGSFDRRREQKIVHVEALCEMMEALTKDTRFTEMVEELLSRQEEGEEIVMCEYIDMLEARGEARGKEIGETRLAELIQRLLKDHKYSEIKIASSDKQKRQELYRLYGI